MKENRMERVTAVLRAFLALVLTASMLVTSVAAVPVTALQTARESAAAAEEAPDGAETPEAPASGGGAAEQESQSTAQGEVRSSEGRLPAPAAAGTQDRGMENADQSFASRLIENPLIYSAGKVEPLVNDFASEQGASRTLTVSQNDYTVSVTYVPAASGIPVGAELVVSEIGSDDDSYHQYIDTSARALGETPSRYALARAFDITLRDPETGEEYQPDGSVKVSIQLDNALFAGMTDWLVERMAGLLSGSHASIHTEQADAFLAMAGKRETAISVVHVPDASGEAATVVDSSRNGSVVEFETDGFSHFVVLMNDPQSLSYSFAGMARNDSVSLSDVLDALHTEYGIGGIAAAEFANDEEHSESNPFVAVTPVRPGGEESDPTDWTLTLSSQFETTGTLTLTLKDAVDPVVILITDRRALTVKANDATKTYDGKPLTEDSVTVTKGELFDGHYLAATMEPASTQTNAGSHDNAIASVAIVDKHGRPVLDAESQANYYTFKFEPGTLTVNPAPVTLTANGAYYRIEENEGHTVSAEGYTCSVPGLTFEGVTASGSCVCSGAGMYPVVTFTGVTLDETRDTTRNYFVEKTTDGLLVFGQGAQSPVSKVLLESNGDLATYLITVNPNGDSGEWLNNGSALTLKDTFSGNQSINYGSISFVDVTYDGEGHITDIIDITDQMSQVVSYDYSGNTGTFTILDGTAVTIRYTTRVQGNAGDQVNVENTAVLGRMVGKEFQSGPSDSVSEQITIDPTGTDILGTGGVYYIDLFVYPQDHMEKGLQGAEFRLLDYNKRPVTYTAGDHAGQPVTFTTGEDGYARIGADEECKPVPGLTIEKNKCYYLEMTKAPYDADKNVYYQKDNTFYSFVITDDPDYSYGGVYSYFNGDVLKVRCYEEKGGVNITKRFTGNYEPEMTDEQKEAIRFVLQKEKPEAVDEEDPWIDVDDGHTFKEFRYGSLNYCDADVLEDVSTYRMIEDDEGLENLLPADVERKHTCTVTYWKNNEHGIVQEATDEFLVDPENRAFSFDYAFTNEYIQHKLTISLLDRDTGAVIPGATFTVYQGDNIFGAFPTDRDGKLTIQKEDGYAYNTLYYAVQTAAPSGYVMEDAPEKIYFYFPETGHQAPAGTPAGATDLTNSYHTVVLLNSSDKIDIPITVTWGHDGQDPWPTGVTAVDVDLHRRIGDTDTSIGTIHLSAEDFYDTSFTGVSETPGKGAQPRVDGSGAPYEYYLVVNSIKDGEGADCKDQYASAFNVSGTGWYVMNIQGGISLELEATWRDRSGALLTGDALEAEAADFDTVQVDLWRTTVNLDTDEHLSGDVFCERADMDTLLKDNHAEKVRTVDLTWNETSKNWKATVLSLEGIAPDNSPYYYYAFYDKNHIPTNHEDAYQVGTDGEFRKLTVRNTQTPVTVTVKLDSGNLLTPTRFEKTYGDDDPDFTKYNFYIDVAADGARHSQVYVPGEDGNPAPEGQKATHYAFTVTNGGSTDVITFTVSRESGENAGSYAITLTGDTPQHSYRVLFEGGTLVINPTPVTITAGGEKTYDGTDTSTEDSSDYISSIVGLKNGESAEDVLTYTVYRADGENVGEYAIFFDNPVRDQGNYTVTYVTGEDHVFTIKPREVTVTADDQTKIYGQDDPAFTATVYGVLDDDEALIAYQCTREPGENVGEYAITFDKPVRDQGNYTVTYGTGTLTINKAALTLKAEDAEKVYGDPDPEWEISVEGLTPEDDGKVWKKTGTENQYEYRVTEATAPLFTFTVTRAAGENVGSYAITPEVTETDQEPVNYTVNAAADPGHLTIYQADLLVTADDKLKPCGVDDPRLTATVEGWVNGDQENSSVSYTEQKDTETNKTISITYTYTRNNDTILTYTLSRESGEEDGGTYQITAAGDREQPNYNVTYEPGTLSILSVTGVNVSQETSDPVDPNAVLTYNYKATLDLTGTGLSTYADNGFEMRQGVPTKTFTLTDGTATSSVTLNVPIMATLTVEQTGIVGTTDRAEDYDTAISFNGEPQPQDGGIKCDVPVDGSYAAYAVKFTHSRVVLPIQAMTAKSATAEDGASVVANSAGYLPIPTDPADTYPNNEYLTGEAFADGYQLRQKYTLPTEDMYYVYGHTSLYSTTGERIDENVSRVKYDAATGKWQYKVGDGAYTNIPAGAQLRLYYIPKYVCKIGTEKFYTLKAAVESLAEAENKTATIEMLVEGYAMRSAADQVTIPASYNITLTTATSGYEGESNTSAVIARDAGFTDGSLIVNNGSLTLDKIVIDGKEISSTAAMISSTAGTLTVTGKATLKDARGVSGGALSVSGGTVTVSGSLTGNQAANGGAVYVSGGTVSINTPAPVAPAVAPAVSGNSAPTGNGGTVYVAGGAVTLNGAINAAVTGAGNSAHYGGAVYVAGGTFTAASGGSITGGKAAFNGGAVYVADGGTADFQTGSTVSDNEAQNGGAIYRAGGSLTVNGSVTGNTAANGGAIYSGSGEVVLGGTLSGNTATTNGGALYLAGGKLTAEEATLSGNTATAGNGGAVYALNAAMTVTYHNPQAGSTGTTLSGNTATAGNGGAVYMEGGSLTVCRRYNEVDTGEKDDKGKPIINKVLVTGPDSVITGNRANKGGAIYATSGTITLENGNVTSNDATEGGAIYVKSASVDVSGGSFTGNSANGGDSTSDTAGCGGVIFAETGAVTITGGTFGGDEDSGNSAGPGSSTKATAGCGGVVYAGSGTVTYSGGTVLYNSAGNNGAAFYIGKGNCNVSASITNNTAGGNTDGTPKGGAIGVGSADARLYFSGNANVDNNTYETAEDGKQSNVYLNADSESVINAKGLKKDNNTNKIGVYVPGAVDTADLVKKRGDICGYFGAYTKDDSVSSVFKNDRFSELEVGYENNRLYWKKSLTYKVLYRENFTAAEPLTGGFNNGYSQWGADSQTYYPRAADDVNVYDIVTAMNPTLTDTSAIYAYTFDENATAFTDFITKVNWDRNNRKWVYQDKNGDWHDMGKLVILYSKPAYLSVVNNTGDKMKLTINNLIVQFSDGNRNAGSTGYGYVTAYNGATAQTLSPLCTVPANNDLVLAPGESRKIMFPGAVNTTNGLPFTLQAAFDATSETQGDPPATVTYTITGKSENQSFNTNGDTINGNLPRNSTSVTEIVFGDKLPICKIGDQTFTSLNAASTYLSGQTAGSYTVEMIVDYLVPKDDKLTIPNGYNVTLTTAGKNDASYPYTGNGYTENAGTANAVSHPDWAIISRDVGQSGSAVIAAGSLTVSKLAFDGLAVAGNGGNGGAISVTSTSADVAVSITDAAFKGYRANKGGAVYVDLQGTGTSLTVEHASFSNCQTNANHDKDGGGGIWTTARSLTVDDCTFDSCACTASLAQAGAVFHNIRAGWLEGSSARFTGCSFRDCYAVGGSGGTLETDALDITIENCDFHGGYTNKSGGNGGAVNIYVGDAAEYVDVENPTTLTVTNCFFEDSKAGNNGNGGAIRTTSMEMNVENCKFKNAQGTHGGAIAMTNSKSTTLNVKGSVFENCTATQEGGAIYAQYVSEITIEDNPEGAVYPALKGKDKDGNPLTLSIPHTHFKDCAANKGGGVYQPKDAEGTSLSITNTKFEDCIARDGHGGGVYTVARVLTLSGTGNTAAPGGTDNTVYTEFTGCTAQNSGGGLIQINKNAVSATLTYCKFVNCDSLGGSGNGGGMYTNAATVKINETEGTGEFTSCTAKTGGGGLFHDSSNGSVTVRGTTFEECTALGSYGGGLYTNAKELMVGADGRGSTFKSCTSQASGGGGVYQNNNGNGSTASFTDCTFDTCTTKGDSGGAIYTPAKTVTLSGSTIKASTAPVSGGGVWMNPTTTMPASSISDTTITGCSVTGIGATGGGVYIAKDGKTVAYENSYIYSCTAANGSGGGLYQKAGTLNMTSGVIQGTAPTGGGLYASGTVTQSGGWIGGTATGSSGSGGGVYFNGVTYNLTGSGVIGDKITVPKAVAGTTADLEFASSAVDGGGVYMNAGTFNLNGADAKITGSTASSDGGGVYVKGGTFNHTNGHVSGTAGSKGGGVYQNATYNLSGGSITGGPYNSASINGGAVYQNTGTLTISGGKVGSSAAVTPANSSAVNGGGLYVAGGTVKLNADGSIAGATASGNGGGAYVAGGTLTMGTVAKVSNVDKVTEAGGSVTGNTAVNGGGVYVAGGTFRTNDGTIADNTASGNGGGVYQAGGTLNLYGGTIGGENHGNRAQKGAGVFVADRQTANIDDWVQKTFAITHNHATVEGGGIAVGGPNAVLKFKNVVKVQDNTMPVGDKTVECNVYLDQDCNTVIKSLGLGAAAHIGVYVSDQWDPTHGFSAQPFGTQESSTSNLNKFVNDRRKFLTGEAGTGVNNGRIVWSAFVCKIADSGGNLLYTDATHETPAVYAKLEDAGGAFKAVLGGTTSFYTKNGDPYTDNYQIQMLVESYGITSQIPFNKAKKVTLTTASTNPDECGFYYNGASHNPHAKIIRAATHNKSLFKVTKGNLTFDRIILDGGYNVKNGSGYTSSEQGGIVYMTGGSHVTIEKDATLQNSYTTQTAGGAVRMQEGNTTQLDFYGTITNCGVINSNENYGGGISARRGVFNMYPGSSITGCSAQKGGGVRVDATMNMSGGTIEGNNATADGGGLSLGNPNPKVNFSGDCVVRGNTLGGSTRCNVHLSRDSNTIINTSGLGSKADIGVYTDDTTNNVSAYTKHGQAGRDFGTRTSDANLFCFVNDVSPELRGVRGSGSNVKWEKTYLLTVGSAVSSDLTSDQDLTFVYDVYVDSSNSSADVDVKGQTLGDMTFNNTRHATVKLKHGETSTALLSQHLDGRSYQVKLVRIENDDSHQSKIAQFTNAAVQNSGWTGSAEGPTTHNNVTPGEVISGTLGESLIYNTAKPTLSTVDFTHTRKTRTLTVEKVVSSEKDADREKTFNFKLTFPDNTDITKEYDYTKTVKNSTNPPETGKLQVTAGEAQFTLLHNQSIVIEGLPTELKYKVEELSPGGHVRVRVSKNGGDELSGNSAEGTVAKAGETPSTLKFINFFQPVVCKITLYNAASRQNELLYIREGNSQQYVPAVYTTLKDAFDQVNNGGLYRRDRSSVPPTSSFRIEMIVPAYEMQETATLNPGHTVTLTTAGTDDLDDYPYNGGSSDDHDPQNRAKVIRGFAEGCMIDNRSSLTVGNIELNGAYPPQGGTSAITATGSIIRTSGNKSLVVTQNALLQDSRVTGNGGAICMDAAGSSAMTLVMDGTIQNCSATGSGGGIYTGSAFRSVTVNGRITGCRAGVDGGAICVAASSNRAASVAINSGAKLTGNVADNNGGAVCSQVKMTLGGQIGGLADGEGNCAGNCGGGVYMGPTANFSMADAEGGPKIFGNRAKYGGGLAVTAQGANGVSPTKIDKGTFQGNVAFRSGSEGGCGGALYVADGAAVLMPSGGSATFVENSAKYGGAIYDKGTVTMKDGVIGDDSETYGNANTADKGSAVYVAGTNGVFKMSGGKIARNVSMGGAVYAEENSTLIFSSKAYVKNNVDSLGDKQPMNVYLDFDTNEIIQTEGFSPSGAYVGVYVADGDSAKTLFYQHGIAARNFATYIGTSATPKVDSFKNDRRELSAIPGEDKPQSGKYVMWNCAGLTLHVKDESNQDLSGVTFRLTNLSGDKVVWKGTTGSDGKVTIPWHLIETELSGTETGGGARFLPGSQYELKELATNDTTVLPAGSWTLEIKLDNEVVFHTVNGGTKENQTHNIVPQNGEKVYLGDTVGMQNDKEPTLTYHANGENAELATHEKDRMQTIDFGTTDKYKDYRITERNPTNGQLAFLGWTTAQTPTPADRRYQNGDTIRFYRGDAEMHLYAQWDEVVCKITDRSNNLLYVKVGDEFKPAVYYRLEDGFKDYNEQTFYASPEGDKKGTKPRKIQMLVDQYPLGDTVTLDRLKTAILTTASKNDRLYPGPDKTCKIIRGQYDNNRKIVAKPGFTDSMIVNQFNLTLTNIILDGGYDPKDDSTLAEQPGGIVSVNHNSAVLTIGPGAVLQNSTVKNGNGGAVYGIPSTTIKMTGGTIKDSSAVNGGGIYSDGKVEISGGSITGNSATKGGAVYADDTTISGGNITGNSATTGGAVYVEPDDSLRMTGGAVSGNTAVNGGAVYLEAGSSASAASAEMTFTGGTISGNTASAAGAGIYLDSSGGSFAKLYLSGSPDFGGTASSGGNHLTSGSVTNGGDTVSPIRQDIYLTGTAGSLSQPLTSLVVTGDLDVSPGSIWVWAQDGEKDGDEERVNHYQVRKQFAVLGDGVTSVSSATYDAFRNARADGDTDCSADYLSGQSGDPKRISSKTYQCIYWTGGFDVFFQKIDGKGDALDGATFTVYTDPRCTPAFAFEKMPFIVNGQTEKRATTVSGDQDVKYKVRTTSGYELFDLQPGEVLLSKLPPNKTGTYYYMKETGNPDTSKYRENDNVYRLQVTVNEQKQPVLKMWVKDGTSWTELNKIRTNSGELRYYVLNVAADTLERQVILRKVASGTYDTLSGAHFRIFRPDLIEFTDGQPTNEHGTPLGYYESLSSGVYYAGSMPVGKYYLLETKKPAGAADDNRGKAFVLTVTENGSERGTVVPLSAYTPSAAAGTEEEIVAHFLTWAESLGKVPIPPKS